MEKVSNIIPYFKAELLGIAQEREVISWAYIVIQHLLGYNRSDCIFHADKEITIEISDDIKQIVRDLKTQKPLQYILGKAEFYGLKFKVNKHTLIPRPETEELVEWIINDSRQVSIAVGSKLKILDIGTGSGCIAISLAKSLDAEVFAVDISAEALQTARQNAKLNEVEVTFIKGDALNPEDLFKNSDFLIVNSFFLGIFFNKSTLL